MLELSTWFYLEKAKISLLACRVVSLTTVNHEKKNERRNGMLHTNMSNVNRNRHAARVLVFVYNRHAVSSNLTFTNAVLMRAKVCMPKYPFFLEEMICVEPLYTFTCSWTVDFGLSRRMF